MAAVARIFPKPLVLWSDHKVALRSVVREDLGGAGLFAGLVASSACGIVLLRLGFVYGFGLGELIVQFSYGQTRFWCCDLFI